MFFYGDRIVNDYNCKDLLLHMFQIKGIRGVDYTYLNDGRIKLFPTKKIKKSPLCYEYRVLSVNTPGEYIGRRIDRHSKKVYDYVFSTSLQDSIDKFPPYSFGWEYNIDCSSVCNYIMYLVSLIPRDKRKFPLYVSSSICSKIDACNDPINGVIEGRWKSTFSDGLSPSKWRNSSHIFSERARLKSPVKYGQCWVLADILTGIYLFLGLPARSVRVDNCIMDLYGSGGMDLYCTTSDSKIVLKGGGTRFDPFDMIDDSSIGYHTKKQIKIEPKEIRKGPIYCLENDLLINPEDTFDINYFVEDSSSRSWNFHVWTEVCVKNEWYVYDSCPIHESPHGFKPYIENLGKKYFGPVKIRDIKSNTYPKYNKENFRYIYNCINGQIRHWNPLVVNGKTILYLANIKRGLPQAYERDLYGCCINVSSRYYSNYDTYHKHHPIKLSIKNNDLSKIYIYKTFESKKSKYVIQVALFYGNIPLYIHRERSDSLDVEKMGFLRLESIRKYRLKADKITFCVYDLVDYSFWSTCIRV